MALNDSFSKKMDSHSFCESGNRSIISVSDSRNPFEPENHSSTSVSDSDEDLRVFEHHSDGPQSEDEQAVDNSHVYRLNLLSWSNRLELESIDLKEKTLEFINEFKHLLNNSKILREINEKNNISNAYPPLKPDDLKTLEKNIIQQIKFQFSNEFFNLQQTIKKFNSLNTPCKPNIGLDFKIQDFLKDELLTKVNEQINHLSFKLDRITKRQDEMNAENTNKSDISLNFLQKKIDEIDSKLLKLQRQGNSDKIIKNNSKNAELVLEKSQLLLNETISVLKEVKSEIKIKQESNPSASYLTADSTKTEIAIKKKRIKKSPITTLSKQNFGSQKVIKNRSKTLKGKLDSKFVSAVKTKGLPLQTMPHTPITRSHTVTLRKTSPNHEFTKLQHLETDPKEKIILTPPNSQMHNIYSTSVNTNPQEESEEPTVYLVEDITYEDKAYENQLMIMGIGRDDDKQGNENQE